MWKGLLLLLICAVAILIVALFEKSWQSSLAAIALVAFAIGYLKGVDEEPSKQ